jgi:hypothetical protein
VLTKKNFKSAFPNCRRAERSGDSFIWFRETANDQAIPISNPSFGTTYANRIKKRTEASSDVPTSDSVFLLACYSVLITVGTADGIGLLCLIAKDGFSGKLDLVAFLTDALNHDLLAFL